MNAPEKALAALTQAGGAAATPLPSYVQIEPVGQCNLRCRMCPIQYRTDGTPDHPPAFMDFDLFCRLIEQFPALTELHLQGMGEPLMHPRFFDMVAHAASRGITVSTNSNLTLLSEARALQCAQSGLARIHVSLDGATEETYRFIRVGAKFERVVRNVGRLNAAKAQAMSELPEIHLVAVAMRANLHELADIVLLAHELGIREVSVQHLCHDFGESQLPAKYRPMRAFVDAQTLLDVNPALVERHFGAAREQARQLDINLRLPNLRPRATDEARRGRCDWPWRGAYLSYAGDAMPCCMVATPDRINFGNMAREGVVRIWNSAEFEAFRARLASDDPPEICRGCALYHGTF